MAHEQSPPLSLTLSLFTFSSENHFKDDEEAVILNRDFDLVSGKRKSPANFVAVEEEKEKLTDEEAVISLGNFSIKELKEEKNKHEGVAPNLIPSNDEERRSRMEFGSSSRTKQLPSTDLTDDEEEEAVILNRDFDSVSRKRKSPSNFSVDEQTEKKNKHEGVAPDLTSNIEEERRISEFRELPPSTDLSLSISEYSEEEAVILNRDFDSISRKRNSPSNFTVDEQTDSSIDEERRISEFPSTDLSLSISGDSEEREAAAGVSKMNSDTIFENFHDELPREWLSFSVAAESEIPKKV